MHLLALSLKNIRGSGFLNQMNGLLWGFFAITVMVWVPAIVMIGLVFSIEVNERKMENGSLFQITNLAGKFSLY